MTELEEARAKLAEAEAMKVTATDNVRNWTARYHNAQRDADHYRSRVVALEARAAREEVGV